MMHATVRTRCPGCGESVVLEYGGAETMRHACGAVFSWATWTWRDAGAATEHVAARTESSPGAVELLAEAHTQGVQDRP